MPGSRQAVTEHAAQAQDAGGVVIVMLVGNPFSGATSAAELLPAGWGAMGQLLPPGASVSLLRSTSYFDGAGTGMPLVVLSLWLVVGIVLAVVASRRISPPHSE